MNITADHLYNLLPSVYRIRDIEDGDDTLKALIEVLADQGGVIEADIARLYENWFIETCDEWVVPYIGDLLSTRNLYEVNRLHSTNDDVVFSRRARVANTIRYRRRKGTITMLEQLGRDSTGWNARAVEFFTRLGWTQNMNHFRFEGHRTLDMRNADELELLETPFGTSAHTVDVRRIARERGVYNIANVGIFLWRLSAYHIQNVEARAAGALADGRYRFDPAGFDIPLFNRPQTETEITHLAEEINVPGPLRRRPLYLELEAMRQALVEGRTPEALYFGDDPVLRVYVRDNPGDAMTEIPPEEILICNLADPPAPIPEGWRRPPVAKDYTLPGDSIFGSVESALARGVDWQVGVAQVPPGGDGQFFTNLTDAIGAWNLWIAANPGGTGVIAVTDNGTYAENLTGTDSIQTPAGSMLAIVSAVWPEEGNPPTRNAGSLEPSQQPVHLNGAIATVGTVAASSDGRGKLIVDGLEINGAITVVQPMPIAVAVDPALGRIALPSGVLPDRVETSYAYGFSGDIAGGPYSRGESLEAELPTNEEIAWAAVVGKDLTADVNDLVFTTLTDAVNEWNTWSAVNSGKVGVIAITDNSSYREDLTGAAAVRVPAGKRLIIASARWPEEGNPPARTGGSLEPNERRAHLRGSLSVTGTSATSSGELVIDGLMIEGTVRAIQGNLSRLRLSHSTIVPGKGELIVASGNRDLGIEIAGSICDRISLSVPILSLTVEESIVNGRTVGDEMQAIVAAQTATSLVRSTVFGSVNVLRIDADTTIVTGTITAERRQLGCVRFSYIPPGSIVPRRYRCQPGLALTERARELGYESSSDLPQQERELIEYRLTPLFTSTRYGDPGYAQLGRSCAEEICTGGENGAEMGAFNFLLQPQREANLRASVNDYLRFGLEAGIIFVT